MNTIKNSYEDITQQFLNDIHKNKKATLKNADSISINGKNYKVNSVNKIIHEKNEKEVAQWICNVLHMNIEFLPNITERPGIKCGDFLINKSEIWELKTIYGNSPRTIDTAIKSKKEQSSNFILDVSFTTLSQEEIIKQIQDVFRRREWVEKVIVKKDNSILKVYKKRD